MDGNEAYKEYQSRIGEAATRIVLGKIGNLQLVKIPEKKGQRTPDYEIRDANGEAVAYCEVKSLVDSITDDSRADISYEELAELSKKRDKNHRSKLKRHLGSAIAQLKGYNHLPTFVAFVSFDMTDYIDMGQVLEEHKELHPDDTIPDSFILMKVHQSISPSETFDITETIRILHNSDKGKEFGENHFVSPDAIKRVGLLPLTFRLEE